MSEHDDFCDNRFQSYLVWGGSRAKKTVANPNVPSKLDWMTGRTWERVDREVIFDTPPPSLNQKLPNPLPTLAYKAPATAKSPKGRL